MSESPPAPRDRAGTQRRIVDAGETLLLRDGFPGLNVQTLAAEARCQHKSLADHLSHLTVHGVLHLLGYDHEADSEAEVMEDMERQILKRLGVRDPYAWAADV